MRQLIEPYIVGKMSSFLLHLGRVFKGNGKCTISTESEEGPLQHLQ